MEPLEWTSALGKFAQIDLPGCVGLPAICVPIQFHFIAMTLQKILFLLTVMPKQLVIDQTLLLSCPRVAEIAVGCVEFSKAVGTYLKEKELNQE